MEHAKWISPITWFLVVILNRKIIYGPLNRDAIVKIGAMIRDRKGDWIFPMSQVAPNSDG